MPSIGFVSKQQDGSYRGQLRTLTLRVGIEIMPTRNKSADNQPDYRIVADGVEIGAGWTRVGRASGEEYVSLSLAAPELPRRIYANLGQAAGQDDPNVYAVIWNPAD